VSSLSVNLKRRLVEAVFLATPAPRRRVRRQVQGELRHPRLLPRAAVVVEQQRVTVDLEPVLTLGVVVQRQLGAGRVLEREVAALAERPERMRLAG
jgi:hypothetical protein